MWFLEPNSSSGHKDSLCQTTTNVIASHWFSSKQKIDPFARVIILQMSSFLSTLCSFSGTFPFGTHPSQEHSLSGPILFGNFPFRDPSFSGTFPFGTHPFQELSLSGTILCRNIPFRDPSFSGTFPFGNHPFQELSLSGLSLFRNCPFRDPSLAGTLPLRTFPFLMTMKQDACVATPSTLCWRPKHRIGRC